jgi:hypothetical protein
MDYNWSVTLAGYPGDKSFIGSWVRLNDDSLYFRPEIGDNLAAEVSTFYDDADFVGAKLNLNAINENAKAEFLTLTGLNLQTQNDETVSIYAKFSIDDSKIYLLGGEFNGTSYSNEFYVGSCDYNYTNHDDVVDLEVTTDGQDTVYYHVYDENNNSVCTMSYNIEDLNISGNLSFNYSAFKIDINDSNALDEGPDIGVEEFKALNMNLDAFKDLLDFIPVSVSDDEIGGKVIVYNPQSAGNGFLLFESGGTFFDEEENASGTWSINDGILELVENGVTDYLAFKDINGSIATVWGFNIEDGYFNNQILILNADQDTVVQNSNEFIGLFANVPEEINVSGTSWGVINSGENITFGSDGSFIDEWNENGVDLNITGTWSYDNTNNVISVTVDNSPNSSIDTLYLMYIGSDEEGDKVFLGVSLKEGEIQNVFMKKTIPVNGE